MNISQILTKHEISTDIICKEFGISCEFDICTSYYWWKQGGVIHFFTDKYELDEAKEEIDEEYEELEGMYQNDVLNNSCEKFEFHTVAFVDNGCGNRYWMILDESKRLVTIED